MVRFFETPWNKPCTRFSGKYCILVWRQNEFCKIYSNNFFGYTTVVVDQPLRKNGEIVTNKIGELKPDATKRDNERVPLSDDINEYFDREVKPHLKDS